MIIHIRTYVYRTVNIQITHYKYDRAECMNTIWFPIILQIPSLFLSLKAKRMTRKFLYPTSSHTQSQDVLYTVHELQINDFSNTTIIG